MHNYVLVSVLIGTNQVGTVVWDLVIEIRVARLSFFHAIPCAGERKVTQQSKRRLGGDGSDDEDGDNDDVACLCSASLAVSP